MGSTDTTVSAATAAVPSDGASPDGCIGAVIAPDNLLLGSLYSPLYGVPPATRPLPATAFLRGLSPRPSTIAVVALENAKTATAATDERMRLAALA
jgi:hypothetical protein